VDEKQKRTSCTVGAGDINSVNKKLTVTAGSRDRRGIPFESKLGDGRGINLHSARKAEWKSERMGGSLCVR